MALPPSTANWHWKNKNVTKWGESWLKEKLTNLSVTGDKEGEIVTITSIFNVEGDVELGQRKSKLITIFDVHLTLDWVGTASDGLEIKGRLDIPEVSHETLVDKTSDLEYDWSTTSHNTSSATTALLVMAKSRFPPLIEEILSKFSSDLIDVHGKDLTVSAGPSRSGTPAPGTSTPSTSTPSGVPAGNASSEPATASQTGKKPQEKQKVVNSSTVEADATFMATAEDLFSLLTDEKRIPAWTRNSAQSTPTPGSGYTLFGGGVRGKYVSLNPPNEIVQTWSLQSPTWPDGHAGTLTTTLTQSSDSTKVVFSLAGVPNGLEDEIKRNIEGYYIHGMKSIGLGTVL